MPTCVKCRAKFPNRAQVGGVQKNLSGRKSCLSCVPFQPGKHRNSALTASASCLCRSCGRQYDYVRVRGGTKSLCNSCSVKKRRLEVKRKAVAYLGGACSCCTYARSLAGLDFHHRDSTTKMFDIANAYSRSWVSVVKELDKCTLLCKNCHAEKHWSESFGLSSKG